jgi:ribosome-binding protein aMBF1 (putative translation factor)
MTYREVAQKLSALGCRELPRRGRGSHSKEDGRGCVGMPKPQTLKRKVFPPGEFIRDELEARGWSRQDLAAILGRPIQVVNLIINGKKAITPETAKELAKAFWHVVRSVAESGKSYIGNRPTIR